MSKRKVVLPVIIMVVALVLTGLIVKSRQLPQPQEKPYLGPLVEVVEVTAASRRIVVTGTGTAQPRFEASIAPQVTGQVNKISPRMVAGGFFRQGEELFTIEAVDYQLALAMAQASLAQTELELARNENLAALARKEWQRLEFKENEEPSPLVVYAPQLKSALAQRDAALAAIKQAELNLQRTSITAPFNCYIRNEQVDVGQYLRAGVSVATVAGTDQMEIVVPVSLDQLAWLQVPRNEVSQQGSTAQVELQSGGKTFAWQGVITRALGEIDPRNRMANVVVTVADPFFRDSKDASLLSELLPGMFVEVHMQGEEISGVIAVPRGALHDNDSVWIVDAENRLHIRGVEIFRRERDEVLVRAGLETGEKVVLSNLPGAAEGMLLRPQLQESK